MNYVSLMEDGKIYIKNKQYMFAEDLFTNLISVLEKEIDPKSNRMLCEAYNNLGYIYYKRVEFDKAVKYYNEAIKIYPSYGTAYYNRGTIHYRLGFYESALKDMEKAVLFEPDNIEFKTGLEQCGLALNLKLV